MRTLMLAFALAGAAQVAAQDKTDEPSYTATVKIDDV
jgi:hypothetical protein